MADSDWRNVDLDTLTSDERDAWDVMKARYKAYQEAKDEFQALFAEKFALPEGKEIKFGYNFGKLSIAVGPKRERKAAKGQETQSLGDWLAAQAAGGHNS